MMDFPMLKLQRSYTMDKLNGPLSDQFLCREPNAILQAIETRLMVYNQSLVDQLQDAYNNNNLRLFQMKVECIKKFFDNDTHQLIELLDQLSLIKTMNDKNNFIDQCKQAKL
jgi:hypothetical protein